MENVVKHGYLTYTWKRLLNSAVILPGGFCGGVCETETGYQAVAWDRDADPICVFDGTDPQMVGDQMRQRCIEIYENTKSIVAEIEKQDQGK